LNLLWRRANGCAVIFALVSQSLYPMSRARAIMWAMIRLLIALAFAALTSMSYAQDVASAKTDPRSALADALNFESQQQAEISPSGWGGGPECIRQAAIKASAKLKTLSTCFGPDFPEY